MTAGHFLFIPAVLIVGVVVGWILGARAARDAYAAELRKREERAEKKAADLTVPRPAGGRARPEAPHR